jgi:threonine aldolase
MKRSFKNDYSELAHPRVLDALVAVGGKQFEPYGLDEYSQRAAEAIKGKIDRPSAAVHFISGGTQTNLIVLSAALRPHEAVIAPHSGHISVHEAGAIEATGHKICMVGGGDGKLRPEDIEAVVAEHSDEHMVVPRLVYISQSTEYATVYTKAELAAVSECCRKHRLYLYIDGARLGAAVNSPVCDLTYADIAGFADAFYFGGTKNGAMYGEAAVIVNEGLNADFRHLLKQRGAILAKGAAVGAQFDELMKDGLYDELAVRAGALARRLADAILEAGYDLAHPFETNMVFPLFPSEVASKLRESYDFHTYKGPGAMTMARLVVSWATPDDAVDALVADLKNFS